MSLTPKNWASFQHYKDRSPPWIKLHKKLIDDYDYSRLPLASRALAPCLWLLASEFEGGRIAISDEAIAFRLHVSVKDLREALSHLIVKGFFIEEQSASTVLAERKHDACLETETETQKKVEKESWSFEKFYSSYPRKVGRLAAQKAFEKAARRGDVSFSALMVAVGRVEASDPKFIPHPATWLNDGRYLDGQPTEPPPTSTELSPEEQADRDYWLAKLAKDKDGQGTEHGSASSVVEAEFGHCEDNGELGQDQPTIPRIRSMG